MIKIASLVPYKIIPAIKGGEKGIYYFLNALSAYATISCFTVSENIFQKEKFEILPVLGSAKSKFRYINPFLYFAIKKECKKNGIRHIIIEHPYYGWLGWALKTFAGMRLIVHSHNIESSRFKTMGKWWWPVMFAYEKFTHRHADLNLFITEEDRQFAIQNFTLKQEKCIVATYGIEASQAPAIDEKIASKKSLCEELELTDDTKLILFNGTLDYAPNRSALDNILQYISPSLKARATFPYKIIICGLRLPEIYNSLAAYSGENIIYKGFVENIDFYFKACDIFINPVTDGGGIKTKLVEALAANTDAVSYRTGAYGVPKEVSGENLLLIADKDHESFVNAVISFCNTPHQQVPETFFEHFNWEKIAEKVAIAINNL